VKLRIALYFSSLFLLVVGSAAAQNPGYRVSGLTSDRPGANHQSPTLLNPWGIAFLPGQGFFIAENASGRVDSYDATGIPLGGVGIPAPPGTNAPFSKPTGIAADPEGNNFGPTTARFQFLVAADNGTIWGFTEANGLPQTATSFVDNSGRGAVYTGVAVLHPDCCVAHVAAANFSQGTIDTFSDTNTPVSLSLNQFTDPNLPAGYSPFNIQKIGSFVFVVYAVPDATQPVMPVPSPGAALVDIFDLNGNFVIRFLSPGAAANVLDCPSPKLRTRRFPSM
jgi:uncharacterized protein (TIGR03118 family)